MRIGKLCHGLTLTRSTLFASDALDELRLEQVGRLLAVRTPPPVALKNLEVSIGDRPIRRRVFGRS